MNNTKDKLIKKRLLSSICAKGDIIKFLEKQASEGLMLEKVVGNTYYFRKEEPCNVKFSVEIFSKASMYDTIPAKTTEEFIEFCEAAGWNYICTNGKMVYFYSKNEDVTPIETDSKAELKRINKYVLGPSVWGCCIIPIIYVLISMISWLTSPQYFSAVNVFISYQPIYNIMYIGIGVLTLLAALRLIIFNSRNKMRVNNGESILYFSLREEKIHNIVAYVVGGIIIFAYIMFSMGDTVANAVIMLVYLVIMALIILLVLVVRKHSKFSRAGNIAINIGISLVASLLIMGSIIVFVIYFSYTNTPMEKNEKKITYIDEKTNRKETALITIDKLPISMKDLSSIEKDCLYLDSICDEYKTVWGEFYECEETQLDKNMEQLGMMLDYEVLKTKVGFIKDSYIDKFIKHGDAVSMITDNKDEAKRWKADKVYLIGHDEIENTYDSVMIVYDDTVVFIESSSIVFSQENIDIFYNKLVK